MKVKLSKLHSWTRSEEEEVVESRPKSSCGWNVYSREDEESRGAKKKRNDHENFRGGNLELYLALNSISYEYKSI